MPEKRLPKELQELIGRQSVNIRDTVSMDERVMMKVAFLASVPESYPIYDKESGMMKREKIKDADKWG